MALGKPVREWTRGIVRSVAGDEDKSVEEHRMERRIEAKS